MISASVRSVIIFLIVVAIFVSIATAAKKGRKKKHEAPKWRTNSMPNLQEIDISTVAGDPIQLDCSAKGKPRPKIQWIINGEEIDPDTHVEFKLKKHMLIIAEVKSSDKGNYTCIVHNKQDRLVWSFNVSVIKKIWPLEVEGPTNITTNIGDTVTFTCKVKNDPNATIRWLKRQEPTSQKHEKFAKTEFIESGPNPEYLIISDIGIEDNGEYRCLAGNKWGVTYETAYLKVMEPTTTEEMTTTPMTMPTTTMPTTEDMVTFFPPNRRQNGKDRKNKNKKRNKNKNRKKHTKAPPVIYEEPTTMYPPFTREWEPNLEMNPTRNYDVIRPSVHSTNQIPDVEAEYNPYPVENENQKIGGQMEGEDTISLWTIYTIVGSIAGVILLLGLVAITVALCCRRDSNGVYKSTPV
ncbi:fibroblast growth factor receptor 1 [Patella vulgata]|uniref:fibroblast growth factor receptor 1 n=1 Tax=Patella vulgata TaxID=6465 RepID=UPI00217FA147|nr:fibroblast growth factor receptor 1 [Patella vulgata]